MKEVFEKIVEILENKAHEAEKDMQLSDSYADAQAFGGKQEGYENAIEIVKQVSEEYSNGHFGCNTNGEHERCDGCGLTNCKSRNKIWFGAMDDDTDTNVGSNGWIPVEEELPETDKYILLSFSNFSIPCVGRYEEDKNGGAFYIGDDDETCVSQDMFVNAWMNLPTPYQPKGE